jgi:hypothetical protein
MLYRQHVNGKPNIETFEQTHTNQLHTAEMSCSRKQVHYGTLITPQHG